MGFYDYLKETFAKEYSERTAVYKRRLTEWRRSAPIVRVAKPLNLARARELGYKAKPGFVIARVRIRKGLRKREKPDLGRKPSRYGRFISPKKSHQLIAEGRASAKFKNLEVLNSYWAGADGMNEYFEVIMVDASHPCIKSDPALASLGSGRAERGLTSAGKKSRGLTGKGIGTEKLRPSIAAHGGRGK